MPFPPSLGLSDVIHLSVIVYNKVVGVFGYSHKEKNRKIPSLIQNIISITIVLVILTIVSSGAVSIIYISVVDKHSTINFVKKNSSVVYDSINEKYFKNKLELTMSPTKNLLVINSLIEYDRDCIKEDNSVVDFLKSNGQDDSFENRSDIAKRYGIPDYVGDDDQNYILLKSIIKDVKDKNGFGITLCRLKTI